MQIKSRVKKVVSLVALTAGLIALSTSIFASGAIAAPTAAQEMKNATARYTAKDYQGALNEFKAVIAKEPNNALAHYYLALCNQCLARVGEAKAEYKWVSERGSGALATQAKAGLAQLDKVNVRTGGDTGSSSMPANAPATASASAKAEGPSKDLIDRGTAKEKDATAGGATAKAAAPTKAADKVAKIVNFYSENSRQSQTMEDNWTEIKNKFQKYTCQKATAGDELCTKYNITEFPTILILDKAGNVLSTQGGVVTADQISTAVDSANSKK